MCCLLRLQTDFQFFVARLSAVPPRKLARGKIGWRIDPTMGSIWAESGGDGSGAQAFIIVPDKGRLQ